MDKYFFVLGRYPEISLAEIQTVLKKNNLEFSTDFHSLEIAVFSLPSSTDLSKIFHSLGGSIKFGKVLGEVSYDEKETAFLEFLEYSYLKANILPASIRKVHFGISVYDGGSPKEIISRLIGNLKDFNNTIKENLKSANIPSGYLKIKERSLSSVAVVKNELINKGFELILMALAQNLLIGKTLAVQDFSAFAKRDMLRPAKDKKSGILPVKLARIMVNLLPVTPRILLDPFCGSGTILMEAALLGIKNLIASDISERAVSDTRKNMDWVFKQENLDKSGFKTDFRIIDARNLDNLIGNGKADAIVTEPFLGPPFYRQPDEFQSRKILSGLIPLYSQSLNIFHKILTSGGNIVMVFPFIQSRGKNIFMDKKIINPSQFKIWSSLLYSSQGQFVGRELVILSKI